MIKEIRKLTDSLKDVTSDTILLKQFRLRIGNTDNDMGYYFYSTLIHSLEELESLSPILKDKTVDKYFSEMYSKIVLEAEKEISEYQNNTPY